MRFQSNKSSCGPAALHNALSALGIHRSEDELIQLTGQTPAGTSAGGILKAVRSISQGMDPPLVGEAVMWRSSGSALTGLWWHITERGRPVILCVDEFEHWVACTGYLGYRFAVMDSADNRLAIYYNAEELLKRWAKDGKYYGIIV